MFIFTPTYIAFRSFFLQPLGVSDLHYLCDYSYIDAVVLGKKMNKDIQAQLKERTVECEFLRQKMEILHDMINKVTAELRVLKDNRQHSSQERCSALLSQLQFDCDQPTSNDVNGAVLYILDDYRH